MRRLAGALVVAAVAAVALVLASGGGPGTLGPKLLVHAARRGDVAILRGLLFLGADAAATSPETSPILAAAWAGHVEVVELLIARGAGVDAADGSGVTPLMAAATQGHDEVVRLLVRHKASLTAMIRCGNALDIALANHRESTAAILRAAGAVPSRKPQ
ncbi:MAG TPA: ankyrin repeat domain-containing protein [Thermoanaerobaculaceae bacterium]|nr:ankyrin repeat domain-containing protein [Thermoanaerobaculaceae bacterium]HPS77835.1 ankyrin repeat domain-containing protein [Thermoanaerobaculaceae bacterium]